MSETNPFGEGVIINLTVWESVEALRDYIYRSPHLDYMRRRREWFDHEGLPELSEHIVRGSSRVALALVTLGLYLAAKAANRAPVCRASKAP